jgi:hypothetical protein
MSRAQEIPKPLAQVAADSNSARAARKTKNPTGAMLRSLILPGWGQFYNGQYLKGVLAVGAETGFIAAAVYWNQRQVGETNSEAQLLYKDYRNQMVWWLAGTILLSMLDAYVDASLSDFDESPELRSRRQILRRPTFSC